jgi:hypothetical protein
VIQPPYVVLVDTATGENTALFVCRDGVAAVRTGEAPEQENPGDDEFDRCGRWIGRDQAAPFRLITVGAACYPARHVEGCFARYDCGDFGSGEAGFAVYHLSRYEPLWLIDDAVRSPEGEPPCRDPATSPGPQTLMTPSEY